MEKIYTAGKNFTLPPGLTGWTNFTSAGVYLKKWGGAGSLVGRDGY